VAADASVPLSGVFQAATAALVFRQGRQVDRIVSAAGMCTPPEVEHFAVQLGISSALAKGCQRLVVFTDSLPAVESLFDVGLRSGQIFSLDACRAVGPWLAGDPDRSVTLWFVPARLEWGAQKAAHDVATSLKIAVGRRPRTSYSFELQRADVEAMHDWQDEFRYPSYRGHNFLDLKGPKGKLVLPSTVKGGPWLSGSGLGDNTAAFSRFSRCVTGHAPLGAYRQRFNLGGDIHCPCKVGYGILETRDHSLYSCPRWVHANPRSKLDTCAAVGNFVTTNVAFCAFAVSRRVWDPG